MFIEPDLQLTSSLQRSETEAPTRVPLPETLRSAGAPISPGDRFLETFGSAGARSHYLVAA